MTTTINTLRMLGKGFLLSRDLQALTFGILPPLSRLGIEGGPAASDGIVPGPADPRECRGFPIKRLRLLAQGITIQAELQQPALGLSVGFFQSKAFLLAFPPEFHLDTFEIDANFFEMFLLKTQPAFENTSFTLLVRDGCRLQCLPRLSRGGNLGFSSGTTFGQFALGCSTALSQLGVELIERRLAVGSLFFELRLDDDALFIPHFAFGFKRGVTLIPFQGQRLPQALPLLLQQGINPGVGLSFGFCKGLGAFVQRALFLSEAFPIGSDLGHQLRSQERAVMLQGREFFLNRCPVALVGFFLPRDLGALDLQPCGEMKERFFLGDESAFTVFERLLARGQP